MSATSTATTKKPKIVLAKIKNKSKEGMYSFKDIIILNQILGQCNNQGIGSKPFTSLVKLKGCIKDHLEVYNATTKEYFETLDIKADDEGQYNFDSHTNKLDIEEWIKGLQEYENKLEPINFMTYDELNKFTKELPIGIISTISGYLLKK